MRKHFILSRPIVGIATHIHRKAGSHPVVTKYSVAFSVVFTGAYMAVNPIHGIPHFVWDGLAYTIHGLGAAPIAEAVLRRLTQKGTREIVLPND